MSKKVLFLILFFMVSNVFALGITPGRTNIDYQSGIEESVDFTIVNSENKDLNLVVFVQGEFNQSVSLSEVAFKMSVGEASKNLKYTIKLPDKLSPGLHTSEVVVMQLPEKSPTSEAFVGAVVGVATQVHVFVPYPGKYAEASMSVIGPDNEGKITFALPIESKGEQNLARVRATIDIYSSLNEKITSLNTNEISVLSKQRGELISAWETVNIPPGPYRAVATVIYDEQVLTIEKEFSVGKQVLELQQVEVNDFSLGGIAKFEMLVENKWSQDILGAYAQMQIKNQNGEAIADFKSQTYDISSLNKQLVVAFWDTAGIKQGDYEASVFLKFGDHSDRKDLKLEVSENNINVIGVGYVISNASGESQMSGLVVILIVTVVVLALINLSWFLFRKRLKK